MNHEYLQSLQLRTNELQQSVAGLEATKLLLGRELQELRRLLEKSKKAAINMQGQEIDRALHEIGKVQTELSQAQETVRELSMKERNLINKINDLDFELTEKQVAYDAEVAKFHQDRNNVVVLLHRLDNQINEFHKKMETIRDTEQSTYELQSEAKKHKKAVEQMAYALEIQINNYNSLTTYSRECLQKEYKLLKLKQQLLDEREESLKKREEEAQIQWQQVLAAKQQLNERSEQNSSR